MALERGSLRGVGTDPGAVLRNAPIMRRVDPFLRRLAAVAQRSDMPAAMIERVLNGEPAVQAAVTHALAALGYEGGVNAPERLTDAVTLFGPELVREACLIALLHLVHKEFCRQSSLDPMALTMQAVAISATTKELNAPADQALLLNIGVAAMSAAFGQPYDNVVHSIAGSDLPLNEAEERMLHTNHGAMGASLMTDFGVPEPFAVAARTHSSLKGNPTPFAVAEAVAHQLGFDGGMANMAPMLPDEILKGAGISDTVLAKIAEKVPAAASRAQRLVF